MRVSLSKEEPDEKNWRNIGLQFSDQSFVSKISNHQIQFYIDQEAKFSFHISRTRMRYINLKVRYHNNIVDKYIVPKLVLLLYNAMQWGAVCPKGWPDVCIF